MEIDLTLTVPEIRKIIIALNHFITDQKSVQDLLENEDEIDKQEPYEDLLQRLELLLESESIGEA